MFGRAAGRCAGARPASTGGNVERISRFASIALATFVAASGVATAQQLDQLKHTTPAERAAASTAVMKQKLELSPEQLTKGAINLEHAEQSFPGSTRDA